MHRNVFARRGVSGSGIQPPRGRAEEDYMGLSHSRTTLAVAVCGAALLATSVRGVAQQPAPAAPQGQPGAGRAGGGGGGRGGVAPALFTAADANKDGAVSREELKTTFDSWFAAADTSQGRRRDAGAAGDGSGVGVPAGARSRGTSARPGLRRPQRQSPDALRRMTSQAMMAALPATAPAKPKQPRKVLVLGRGAGVRPLVDSARREDDRSDGQEDQGVDDDDHVRPRRHQRRRT